MKLFVGKAYEQRFQLAPGIEARFVDVGHLLGSASIELWITEGETTTKLVFSGDIGNLESAHHQGSCLHQRGGLRLYGIYLRRPQPRPEAGLCERADEDPAAHL